METTGASVSVLFRKFQTCESYVRHGKIAACIVLFLEVLEKMPSAPLLAREKKILMDGIFKLQKALAAHQNFKDLFGPVTFDDTDLKTTHEFLGQLKMAHEEEIRDRMAKETADEEVERLEVDAPMELDEEAVRERATMAIQYMDDGDMPKAVEAIDGMDEVTSYIINYYNALGIQCREAARYEDAIANYRKALAVFPHDEGLHYNIARAYHAQGHDDSARESVNRALEINPDFEEGQKFSRLLSQDDTPSPAEKKNGRGLIPFLRRLLTRKKPVTLDESNQGAE